jgi:hypothetical protein
LDTFHRVEPYHGRAPGWRLGLLRERKFYSANVRFTYTGGERNFIHDERAMGTDRFGSARNRQILVFGDGRRPVTTTNLTLSFFPTEKITIANHSAYHHTRMEGDASYRELNNATLGLDLVHFRFLGIRTFANLTDLNYRPAKWIGLYGGYHVSQRRIRSTEQSGVPGFPETASHEQSNLLHSGLAGLRFRLAKPLTLNLDGEIGRADRPFFPISDRNYHGFGARLQYKTRALLLSGFTRTFYNINSESLAYHSARGRTYAADLSWMPNGWFAIDAGYSKQHLDTNSAIAYFMDFQLVTNRRSIYTSNIHSGNLGARFAIRNRADIFVGYSRVQDTGGMQSGTAQFLPGPADMPPLFAASSFPLTFESPMARISVRINNSLRWNIGYQHYRYAEDFLLKFGQNYRAHTGYSSVSWSF